MSDNPHLYTTDDLLVILPYNTKPAIYKAKADGRIPPGIWLSGRFYFPKYQIDAILQGLPWKDAKPPTDAAIACVPPSSPEPLAPAAPLQVGGLGATQLIEALADLIAERVASKIGGDNA